MHPNCKESNYQDSVKKYLLSTFAERNTPIVFDRTLRNPDTLNNSIDEWVSVIYGSMIYGATTMPVLYIYCCTRGDAEQYRLVRLTDFTRSLFLDSSMPDGIKRIPVYNFDTEGQEQIGFVLPRDIASGDTFDLNDQTKVRQLTIQLWYPTNGSL